MRKHFPLHCISGLSVFSHNISIKLSISRVYHPYMNEVFKLLVNSTIDNRITVIAFTRCK
nr:hypothetical protein [uncultured bacterium]